MRQFFMALSLCLFVVQKTVAQQAFYIYITDKSRIQSVEKVMETVTPIFDDEGINDIISNYTVTDFRKAFPYSEQDYLHKFYRVECNSLTLAEDLHAYDSVLFPAYGPDPEPVPTAAYTPNDWGLNWDAYLEMINVREAWGITKGDPNVVIGVTDTYFDINHPDMINKFAHVGPNNLPGSSINHGVLVAGIIAAATDNAIGYPGVGFNCRLDVSNGLPRTSHMQEMSLVRGRKVLNASWLTDTTNELNLSKNATFFATQGVYNEIYANGTICIFGAGNGRPIVEGNPRSFTYPASFDHNISVSNVGWSLDTPTNNFNCKYIHEMTIGDTVTCYQHNTRVDICAPSIQIGGHDYDPGDPSKHYQHGGGWGTSFGAPMVAGVCGLMLAHTPWLSPYQMEYVLKKSAFDMKTPSANKKYAGRIGWGGLDAGAALNMLASDNIIDTIATRTFVIEGIDLNTRCAPDAYVGTPKPRLKVKLKNGTPPYTYKWEPMPDNNVFLDVLSPMDSPIVFSSYGTHLLHYRLTVYDATDVQKVANKVIKIQLTHDSTSQLVMRDAYADMFNERNNMDTLNPNDWNVWESPDVWNRQTNDKVTTHEDPEFFIANPNYLYTRIKNVGCISSPSPNDSTKLKLYWTIASTGETWNMDWNGSGPAINGHICGQEIVPGGLNIPIIKPGAEEIIEQAWFPPQPQLYDTLPKIDVCVLARIEKPFETDFGMTIPEDSLTRENVWNNNKIVTRNLVVHNLNTANKQTGTSLVVIGNTSGSSQTFTLQVATSKQLNPSQAGYLGQYMDVTLHLDDAYDLWVSGGRQGNVLAFDDQARTVTCDLSEPLRLENVALPGHARIPAHITFKLKDDITIKNDIEDQYIYFRQIIPQTIDVDYGDGTSYEKNVDYVYGNVSYAINIEKNVSMSKPTKVDAIVKKAFVLYPNPTQDNINIILTGTENTVSEICITDIAGRVVLRKKNVTFANYMHLVNTSSLQPGMYIIKVTDKAGKAQTEKFIKMDK